VEDSLGASLKGKFTTLDKAPKNFLGANISLFGRIISNKVKKRFKILTPDIFCNLFQLHNFFNKSKVNLYCFSAELSK